MHWMHCEGSRTSDRMGMRNANAQKLVHKRKIKSIFLAYCACIKKVLRFLHLFAILLSPLLLMLVGWKYWNLECTIFGAI